MYLEGKKIKNIFRIIFIFVMAFCLIALSFAMVACDTEKQITLVKVDTAASILSVEQGGTIDDLNIVVKGNNNINKNK